jgi:hypothetical protein
MRTVIIALIIALAVSKNLFLDQSSIIEKVNTAKTTWTAGQNHYFDGKTIDEIKAFMGTLETPEHLKLPLKEIEPLKDIPEEFFSATQWPNCQSIK